MHFSTKMSGNKINRYIVRMITLIILIFLGLLLYYNSDIKQTVSGVVYIDISKYEQF